MASPQFQEPVLHTNSSLENDWTVGNTDNFSTYYDPDSFLFPANAGATYDHYPEHSCVWPNTDILYPNHHSDNFAYSSYYSPIQSFDPIFSAEHTIHQKNDLDAPILAQSHLSSSLIPSHPQPTLKSSCPRQGTFPSYDQHRSSIALASDTYPSQASSLSNNVHSSTKHENSLGYVPTSHFQSSVSRHTRPQSKKRSFEAIDLKEEDGAHLASSTTNDPCCLAQPHMIVPSQGGVAPLRMPYHGDHSITSLHRISHHHERNSLLLRPDDRSSVPKQFSNKRFHRPTEELIRQESGIRAIPPTHATWQNPDNPLLKSTKKGGEQKKQALACLFCRERKIACGRPPANNPDQTCNQCSRRRIKCEYPTESRRGQHKRRRKTLEGEATSQTTQTQSSTRSSSASSSVASTTNSISASSPPNVVPSASA